MVKTHPTPGAPLVRILLDDRPEIRDKVDRLTVIAMNLGVFSVSLAVKDIQASLDFYGKLGFKQFGGDPSQGWAILKNGDQLIGLFQGMFDKNILTFNPGWDSNAREVPGYTDVREIQRQLRDAGMEFATEADERTTGPASFIIIDPDGNPVLVDQHL